MKKIKVFYDPIKQIPKWLNSMSEHGYRLKSVNNCIYDFEKTYNKYVYQTQFIGYNPNKDNINYIDMLEDSNHRVFRAPLNQLNFVWGKIKIRPLEQGSAKISTSFDNYNKEILIVEFSGEEEPKLLSSNKDICEAYKTIRNAYFYGLLICIFLLCMVGYKLITEKSTSLMILMALILVLTVIVSIITNENNKSYRHYLLESNLRE